MPVNLDNDVVIRESRLRAIPPTSVHGLARTLITPPISLRACGGDFGTSSEVDAVYRALSPLFNIQELLRVNLSVHHGRHDEVVSWRHSWNLATALHDVGGKSFYLDIFDGGARDPHDTAFRWFDRLAGTEETRFALTG